MRRIALISILLAVAAMAVWATVAASRTSLLEWIPGEPLVVVAADDLPQLAARVRELPAAKEYLDGQAHDAYSDSKLALKLADRAKRLGKLAGTELTLSTLFAHAGGETALALYDIGELQFLVLVRMDAAEQSKLEFVKAKADFTERVYEGRTYLAKVDYNAGQAFAFYQQNDLLVVSNNIDLIEGALLARAQPDAQPRLVAGDTYRRLRELQPDLTAADATVYLDMKRLRDDRYFKVYWAWRNFDELAAVDAVLIGFDCDGRTMRERRALLGPTAVAPPYLAYDGDMSALLPGGESTTARLSAHLGWPLNELDLDGRAEALLLIAQPAIDEETGVVVLRRGAAIADVQTTPTHVLQAVAAGMTAPRPALPYALTPKTVNGVVSLTTLPELPGAYAMRRGDLLLLADDETLLRAMAEKVKRDEPGPLQTANVTGEAAMQLATFLQQAKQWGAARDDGASFATNTLVSILQAAGNFKRMTAVTTPQPGGLVQETRWQ